MEKEPISEARQLSKYNTAAFINSRLHTLWIEVTNSLKSGKFNRCDLALNDLWIELAGDLDPDDYQEHEKELKNIDEELFKYGFLSDGDNHSLGFGKINKKIFGVRHYQYRILIKKSLFLKRVEKLLGKGTAWTDEQEDEWD